MVDGHCALCTVHCALCNVQCAMFMCHVFHFHLNLHKNEGGYLFSWGIHTVPQLWFRSSKRQTMEMKMAVGGIGN